MFFKFFFLTIFLILQGKGDTEQTTKPNIVFIFADDWGWNDVGYNGGSKIETTFLDSLAQDSLILKQHYVQPTCTPSRAAFLTGRYPAKIGMQHSTISPGDLYGVPLETVFLSEQLKTAGYTTHMLGKWHLGYCTWDYTPTYRGFDTFSGYYLGGEDYCGHNRSVGDYFGYDLRRQEETVLDVTRTYSTYWYYNEFVDLVSNTLVQQDSPFFLYFAWQNSHTPPQATEEYLSKYSSIATGGRKYFSAQTHILDDVMKDVIQTLKDNNLWDNTLIVFSSDNGGYQDAGDNAPLRGSKSTLWEGAIRVPAFVTGGYLPDSQKGTECNEMIHVTDWYPTFLKLAGLSTDNLNTLSSNSDIVSLQKIGNDIDGYDISDVIFNNQPTERDTILINVDNTNCNYDICGAVRWKNYKMIQGGSMITSSAEDGITGCMWIRDYLKDETSSDLTIQCSTIPDDVDTTTCDSCKDKPCLFDLSNDPCEYYDVSEEQEYSEIYQMLLNKLTYYYNTQLYAWKDIFDSDYENADPALFNDFWTPWLTYEELSTKQTTQFQNYHKKSRNRSSKNNDNDETSDDDDLLKSQTQQHNNNAFSNNIINDSNNIDTISLILVVPAIIMSLLVCWMIKKKCWSNNGRSNDQISENKPLLSTNFDNINAQNYDYSQSSVSI